MGVFHDNAEMRRFELEVSGHTVSANYRIEGATLFIEYVEAPPALRGTGAAGRLMEEIVRLARARALTIVPICGYAAAWMKKYHHAN